MEELKNDFSTLDVSIRNSFKTLGSEREAIKAEMSSLKNVVQSLTNDVSRTMSSQNEDVTKVSVTPKDISNQDISIRDISNSDNWCKNEIEKVKQESVVRFGHLENNHSQLRHILENKDDDRRKVASDLSAITVVTTSLQNGFVNLQKRISDIETNLSSLQKENFQQKNIPFQNLTLELREELNSLSSHIRQILESHSKPSTSKVNKNLDTIVADFENLKQRVSQVEGRGLTGAVKTAEVENIQQKVNHFEREESEAVHDVAVLTELVDSLVRDVKLIKQNQENFFNIPPQQNANLTVDQKIKRNGQQMDEESPKFSKLFESQHSLQKDLGMLKKTISDLNKHKLHKIVTRIEDLEGLLLKLPPDVQKRMNLTSRTQTDVVHDVAALTGLVSGLSNDLQLLKSKSDSIDADHSKLNYTSVNENIAIRDLASLSTVVFSLAKDFQELKQANVKSVQLDNKVKFLSDLVDAFKGDVQDMRSKLSNLKLSSDLFESDHSKLNNTSFKENVAIHDLASLTNIVSFLSKDLKELKGTRNKDLESVAMKSQVNLLQNFVHGLKSDVEDLKKTVSDFNLASGLVDADHAQLNYAFVKEKAAIKDLAALTNIVSVLSKDVDSMKQTNETVVALQNKLKNELKTLSNILTGIKGDLKDAKNTISVLKSNLQTAANDHEKLNETFSRENTAIKDIVDLSNFVFKMSKEFQNFREETKSNCSSLKNRVNEMKTIVDRLQDTVNFGFSDELNVMKSDVNTTLVHQMNAVHDIAYLTDIVEDLKNELQNIKHSSTLKNNAVQHIKQDKTNQPNMRLQQTNRSVEGFSVLSKKIQDIEHNLNDFKRVSSSSTAEKVRPEFTLFLSDLSELKTNLNSTRDHQLKAVHDIALLSGVVNSLKNDLNKIQLTISDTNHRDTLKLERIRVDSVQTFSNFSKILEALMSRDIDLSNELFGLKKNFDSTRDHQLKAVHDIALLSGVVDFMKNDLTKLQSTPNVQKDVLKLELYLFQNISHLSKALEHVKKQIGDLKKSSKALMSRGIDLSNELFGMKSRFDSTRDHQLKAVNDVSLLANVVEALKSDVQVCKKSTQSFDQNDILKKLNKLNSLEGEVSHLKKAQSSLESLQSTNVKFSDLSNEFENFKRNLNVTHLHQLSAIHDISYLTNIVEGLNSDIQTLKSFRKDNNGNQLNNITSIQLGMMHQKNSSVDILSRFSNRIEDIEKSLRNIRDAPNNHFDRSSISRELETMKKNISSTSHKQIDANREIVRLKNFVEKLNSQNQNVDLALINTRIDEIAKRQKSAVEDLALLSNIVSEMRMTKQIFANDNPNQRSDSVLSHQKTAIHDIALLSKSVEKLTRDLSEMKKISSSNGHDLPQADFEKLNKKIESTSSRQNSIGEKLDLLIDEFEDVCKRNISGIDIGNGMKKNASHVCKCCLKIDSVYPRIDHLENSFGSINKEWKSLADLMGLLKSDFQKFERNGIEVDRRRLDQLEIEVDKMKKNSNPQSIIGEKNGRDDPKLVELTNLVKDLGIEHRKFERLFQQLQGNVANKENVANRGIENSNESFIGKQIVEYQQHKLKELSDTVER